MLHILLLILKIIGIVLAIIIGVLLFAIILILFVPVRYRVNAEGEWGKDEPFHVEIRVTWLLHLVNILLSYPNASYIKARILIFTIFDSSKPRISKDKGKSQRKESRENRKKRADKKNKTEEMESDRITSNINGEVSDNDIDDGRNDNTDNEKNENIDNTINDNINKKESIKVEDEYHGDASGTEAEDGNTREVRDDAEEKDSLWIKIKNLFAKIVSLFLKLLDIIRNIEYTITSICDKIKKVIGNIGYYAEIIQGELFKEVFGFSKNQLFRVIRSIRPRKCDICLTIGTGDPASTGQIFAIYGMLYPFIGRNVSLQADFEEMIIKGNLKIRGKVTAFTLLIVALRLYRDKNIRQLLKMLKREDA